MREENNLTHAKREIKETKDKIKNQKKKKKPFFRNRKKIMKKKKREQY